MENQIENDVLGFDPRTLLESQSNSQSTSSENSLIYHTRPADSKSEDGVYRATIKVIYSPFDFRHSLLEQQSYTIHDAEGWLSVISSLTVNDKSCPIFNAWKKCHFAKENDGTFKSELNRIRYEQALPIDKGGKGLFDKRYSRYVTIQVISDKNKPELEGQYLFWKLPKSILEVMNAKQAPSPESGKPVIPVMDCLFGRSIDIEVTPGPDDAAHPERKTREIKYMGEISDDTVSCTTPEGKSLLTSDEQAVLDTYIDEMTKNVWKNKDPEDRATKLQAINAEDNTKQLRSIYLKVIEQMKQFCPDLNAELGYKPWSEATAARVQKWIDIVLAGNDPAAEAPVATSATPQPSYATPGTTNAPVAPSVVTTSAMPAAPATGDDDLPF